MATRRKGSGRKATQRSASNKATIYFATNRNPNRKNDPDDFGGEFNEVSVDSLRFGEVDCSLTGKTAKIDAIRVAPEKLAADQDATKYGSKAVFETLRESMRGGVDTLAFIHGYNVSFHEAILTGARIVKNYSAPLNVVVFSWPSDGSMMPFLAYKRDRTDAKVSAPALARALLKLRDFLVEVRAEEDCGSKLHLMAHSMGNYVLRHGIQEALATGGRLPRLFDQIFLMAADEDDDAFDHDYKLQPLPKMGNGVNVYFNRGDTALVVSDRTKNNPTRLGSQGPDRPLNMPANVTNVDCSEIVSGIVEHGYFVDDARVVADIEKVLAGKAHDQIGKRRYVASQNRYVLMKN